MRKKDEVIENEEITEIQKDESVEKIPAGLEVIGEELIGDMPEVSENAISQFEEKERRKQDSIIDSAKQAEGLLDRHGNTFDPDLHKVDEATGAPILTLKGKLRLKVGAGRPAKSSTAKRSTLGKRTTQSDPSQMQDIQKARAAGVLAANSFITLCVALGGDEWRPIKNDEHGIDERKFLADATADYFEASGISDFPPSVTLMIAAGSYALPRFTLPQTKSKSKNLLLWIRDKWAGRKAKKEQQRKDALKVESEKKEDKA